jgi:hypothetical protein
MTEYSYFVVESSFVARVGRGSTERLDADGTWVSYPDRWHVLTSGRLLANEQEALKKARQLVGELDDRGAK